MNSHDETLPSLTRGEEAVMQVLWSLGDALVYDIIDRMPEPKPKYSTIATFIKMLENKGYVAHREEGRFYRYYPVVPREQYASTVVKSVMNTYFDGSVSRLVSFFARREKISPEEIDEITRLADSLCKKGEG